MIRILVTGFGPFPGAPANPTGPLVRRLARAVRMPRVKIAVHVFEASYAAVDRELPTLIAREKPDALLMFGLATRAQLLRVETLARNVVALVPDVSGKPLQRRTVVPGAPATKAMPAAVRPLLAALRKARVPAMLSRDAGSYVCNYLCWRGAEAVAAGKGPRMAAFIHVPPLRAGAKGRISGDDLARGGAHILAAFAKAVRH
jgi:pyroglutamyl-peptidase